MTTFHSNLPPNWLQVQMWRKSIEPDPQQSRPSSPNPGLTTSPSTLPTTTTAPHIPTIPSIIGLVTDGLVPSPPSNPHFRKASSDMSSEFWEDVDDLSVCYVYSSCWLDLIHSKCRAKHFQPQLKT